jgi:hypothetical protein
MPLPINNVLTMPTTAVGIAKVKLNSEASPKTRAINAKTTKAARSIIHSPGPIPNYFLVSIAFFNSGSLR